MTDEVLVRAEHICKYFKIGGGRMLHAVEDSITAAAVSAARVLVSFIFYRPFRVMLRGIPLRKTARARNCCPREPLWKPPRRSAPR